MSDKNMEETTVEKVDIDIDEVFGASADNITLAEEEPKKPNMFSRPGSEADFSFTKAKEESEAEESEADEDDVEVEANTETSNAEIKAQGNDILDDISIDTEEEDVEESKVETRGRKPINGFTDEIICI
jgi:basic membrane lipoprotein Med (substrate-binding protein (PBP1-ABC) superfamily)